MLEVFVLVRSPTPRHGEKVWIGSFDLSHSPFFRTQGKRNRHTGRGGNPDARYATRSVGEHRPQRRAERGSDDRANAGFKIVEERDHSGMGSFTMFQRGLCSGSRSDKEQDRESVIGIITLGGPSQVRLDRVEIRCTGTVLQAFD